MRRARLWLLLSLVLLLAPTALAVAPPQTVVGADDREVVGEFLLLLMGSDRGKRQALRYVSKHWQRGFAAMLLETLTLNQDAEFSADILRLLQRKTGRPYGFNIGQWQRWLWNRPPQLHPQYAEYKSALYGLLDEKFERYFSLERPATIRLDEVLWGGVKQDGIPPLRNPDMVAAVDADYLADDDVVFGLTVNGDARAYPQRILAWHEMFVDTVGGTPVAGVYCTLCGTMILYKTRINGVNYELGTSGFLYRSNKLMYDRATQSLWSSIWGRPVIGPLVNKGIELESLPLVTTRWAQWRHRHPDTAVLSLATGYTRDYTEGAAYHRYFATDKLMFNVPVLDHRLRNKDEVLALILPAYPDRPLAISAAYLVSHPVYTDAIGDQPIVVFTDSSGANRVYENSDVSFVDWDGDRTASAADGKLWQLTEERLINDQGRVLHRLPARRAFWFGWYSAYSNTRLVK